MTSSSSNEGEKPVSFSAPTRQSLRDRQIEMRRREIDTNANVMPTLLPKAALPASGLHDPERDAV